MNLVEFFDECKKIDTRLKEIRGTLPYNDSDNRKEVFGVLRSQIIHYEILLHVLHAKYKKTINPDEVFKEVFGIGYEDHEQWKEFQVTMKDSLVVLFHFVIENFLKTLLGELAPTTPVPRGFYNLAKTLLEKIDVDKKDEKLDVLNTLAMQRNSFHNNGIHNPIPPAPDISEIFIDDIRFYFEKGKPTELLESEMVVLLNSNIEVLNKIVESSEVKVISTVPLLFIPKI